MIKQGAVDIKKDDFDGVHKAPRFLGVTAGTAEDYIFFIILDLFLENNCLIRNLRRYEVII